MKIREKLTMNAHRNAITKSSLNSAEVHRLFDMTGSLFECLSYFKLY